MKKHKIYSYFALVAILALPTSSLASEAKLVEETTRKISKVEEEKPKLIDDLDIETSSQDDGLNNIDSESNNKDSESKEEKTEQISEPTADNLYNIDYSLNYKDYKGDPLYSGNKSVYRPNSLPKDNSKGDVRLSIDYPKLKRVEDGSKLYFDIDFAMTIMGDKKDTKPCTIDLFALKDSNVGNLSFDSRKLDETMTFGKDNEKYVENIENEYIKGYRLKFDIRDSAWISQSIRIDSKSPQGDYTLYYRVNFDGKTTFGKLNNEVYRLESGFALADNSHERFINKTNNQRDNIIDILPYQRLFLNDSNMDASLTDFYIEFSEAEKPEDYVFKITYIDPEKNTLETELIDNIFTYKLRANSLAKFEAQRKDGSEIRDISSKNPTSEETTANPSEKQKDPTFASLMPKSVNFSKDSTAKVNVDEAVGKIDEKNKEINEKLDNLDQKSQIVAAGSLNQAYVDLLADEIDRVDKEIRGLIHSSLLEDEVKKLEELEKENPDKAKEEYQKIKNLVDELRKTQTRVETKLIDLKEVAKEDYTSDLISIKKDEPTMSLNLQGLGDLEDNLLGDNLKQRILTIGSKVEKSADTNKIKENERPSEENPQENKKDDKNTKNKKVNTKFTGLANYLSGLEARSELLTNK